MSVSFTVEDRATPALEKVLAGLRDRTRLHEFAGRQVQTSTSDYLRMIAPRKHKTANRLGAQPTGHLSSAAESVTSKASGNDAVVTITSPGIRRAFRELRIQSRGRLLTIPASAQTYGKRARDFTDLTFIPFQNARRTKALAWVRGRGRNRQVEIAYWLLERVNIPQDRELLPSSEALAQAATEGAKSYIRLLLQTLRNN